jgi:hypothetical protein
VVQLFMAGAASHLDLWDYKPALEKLHGEKSDFGEPVEAFQDGLGPWMKSPFAFRPCGECGKPLSDVVSPLGEVVDEIAFVHNVVGKTGVHSQATFLQATGFQNPGFPGMGAWISYGLGSMNDELPTARRTGPRRSCPPRRRGRPSFLSGRTRSRTCFRGRRSSRPGATATVSNSWERSIATSRPSGRAIRGSRPAYV